MWGILLLAVVVGVVVCRQTVTIEQHWNRGFKAKFCIDITKELHTWRLHLNFDQPIDSIEVWVADAERRNKGREYILTNKAWNIDEHIGDELCVDFLAHTSHDIQPIITVHMEGMGETNPAHNIPSPSLTTQSVPITTRDTTQSVPITTRVPSHSYSSITTNTIPNTGGGHERFDYAQALGMSILFYDAQRSGKLPANNPIAWRGDSALTDGSDVGVDLTGGWYDAGDHVKFNFPMASSTTILLWGLIQWRDAYTSANQLDQMYDMIRWPLDYFLKCWKPDTQTLYVQVGNGITDHKYWGRAEDMTMNRPSFALTPTKPGSDAAGETAAAMAAASIAFKTKDAAYSTKLLTAAKSLYEFGKKYPGRYSESLQGAAMFYGSSSTEDEMCEAAMWLYKATSNRKYLNDAVTFYHEDARPWAYSWDDKKIACQMLLYEATQASIYRSEVTGFLKSWFPGGNLQYTPCGLAYRDQWGPNRYAANVAFMALIAADAGIDSLANRKWALGQMNYLLGENRACQSYVIGFGTKYPTHPHHRSASCPDIPQSCGWERLHTKGASPHVLVGALVGGPASNDAYTDNREDAKLNEVACDYNAGFQSALAGFQHLIVTKNLPTPDPPKCPCSRS